MTEGVNEKAAHLQTVIEEEGVVHHQIMIEERKVLPMMTGVQIQKEEIESASIHLRDLNLMINHIEEEMTNIEKVMITKYAMTMIDTEEMGIKRTIGVTDVQDLLKTEEGALHQNTNTIHLNTEEMIEKKEEAIQEVKVQDIQEQTKETIEKIEKVTHEDKSKRKRFILTFRNEKHKI